MSNKESYRAEVLRGTLDLMVLQTLAALGPQHGYAIGARLEQQGLIKAEWGVTDNNRQARFYTITAAGRRRLATEKKAWDQRVAVIRTLFEDPA